MFLLYLRTYIRKCDCVVYLYLWAPHVSLHVPMYVLVFCTMTVSTLLEVMHVRTCVCT